MLDHEGGLLLVTGIHPDLVVARESVHETKDLVVRGGIYYKVDPRQGKTVFWAGSIDVSEVNAESSFAIFLFDENHINQPIGVIYFPDSSGLEEFADFFIDRFLSLWGEGYSFLFDRFEGGADI